MKKTYFQPATILFRVNQPLMQSISQVNQYSGTASTEDNGSGEAEYTKSLSRSFDWDDDEE